MSDATPAIFAVLLLFACPKENIFAGKLYFKANFDAFYDIIKNKIEGKPYQHLIDWKSLQKIFPWSIVLLLGGGLVMADGFKVKIYSFFFIF